MWDQLGRRLSSLQGRQVSLSLKDGTRIDDCQLISGGRHRRSLWVFTNGADTFVPIEDVTDLWEVSCY